MLQNARVTAFTVSELLSENQQWGKVPPPRLGLNWEKVNIVPVEKKVAIRILKIISQFI